MANNGEKNGVYITKGWLTAIAVGITLVGIIAGSAMAYATLRSDVTHIIEDRALNPDRYAPYSSLEKIDIQLSEINRRLNCIENKLDAQNER